jgi:DNA-binding LacI/PurR family transcriptional regulator
VNADKMAESVTLKMVAKHAGVSYQTVSKVVNNQGQISPALRLHIQQSIDELGYRPNAAAQALRTHASHLIGYSWSLERKDHSSFILDQFQHDVVEEAEDAGYHILLVPHRTDHDVDSRFRELVKARRVDGFILSSIEYNDPRIESVARLKVPLVSFGRSHTNDLTACVDVDGRAGIAKVVHYLIDNGHRRIGLIAWPEHSRVGNDRLAGYLDAMTDSGLPVDPAWIVRGSGEIEYGYAATQQLLAIPESSRPTAIVTMLDTIAMGAMQAVETCGLIIGRDIAVTGFDDMPAARHLKPGLTTLRQPIGEVAKAVLSLLLAQLNGEQSATQPLMLSPELVIRESSQGYGRVDHEKGSLSTVSA